MEAKVGRDNPLEQARRDDVRRSHEMGLSPLVHDLEDLRAVFVKDGLKDSEQLRMSFLVVTQDEAQRDSSSEVLAPVARGSGDYSSPRSSAGA